MIPTLLAQPDEALDSMAFHDDFMQGEYTFPDKCIAHNRIHVELLGKTVPRHLSSITLDLADEIRAGFEEYWGTDTNEWKDISLPESTRNISTRMSTRLFLGPTVCRLDRAVEALFGSNKVNHKTGRNEKALRACSRYTLSIIYTAMLIRFLPQPLKP
jgi:hypothetical protein